MNRVLLLVVSFVLLTLVGLFAREYKRVSSFPVTAWTADHSADCALVLTGGVGRVREGFALLSRKEVKKLIISGVHPQAQLHEIFPQLIFYGNIDERDIVLERRSTTTYGNAQQSQPLVEALHCRDIVLITSNLHMYRSLKTIQAVFPRDLAIHPRAVLSGPYRPSFSEVGTEAAKSLFYSLWAY